MPAWDENVLLFMRAELPSRVKRLISQGRFDEAKKVILEALRSAKEDLRRRLEFELDRIRRWRYEYPYTMAEALERLRREIPDVKREELDVWLRRGCIDHRIINGEVRVLRRFVPNLFWLCPELKSRRLGLEDERAEMARAALRSRVEKVIAAAREVGGGHVLPLLYRVRASVRVKPGAVPEGETLRIWIPLPRSGALHPRVRVLDAEPKPLKVAPEDHPQRTAYFELEASRCGAECWIEYEFISRGFYLEVDPRNVQGYDEGSDLYRRYTSERPPHIAFTPYLRELAERIVGDEENPYLKARRIWEWVTNNVRYTYARDYALYDNISEYVARNRRGDCGMQALLFITLCRIAGVPARWQSGWYVFPLRPGMHDWAQFYVEPYGWLYADPSFGNMRHGEKWRNEFYFGSIEGYRMAANVEVSAQFDPPKQHFRSDPVDNQRGEVEWREGNLYYDVWEYDFKILETRRL